MGEAKAGERDSEGLDLLAPGLPINDFLPYLLNRIATRLNHDLLEDLRPLRITVSRWRVLAVLMARNGRSIGELAVYTVTKQSALSRVVDQMERDGLVARRPGKADSRVVEVYLTAAGRKLFEVILPKALKHFGRALDGFSREDAKTLTELLHRVLDNVRVSPYA